MLGSGTVTLCSRSGGTLTADGQTVTVYNSGGTISGPKTLALDWTDGDWAVCVCGQPSGPCCWLHCATVCGDACYGLGTITDDQGSHDLIVVQPGSIGFGGFYQNGTRIHEPGGGIFAGYYWFVGCGADPGKIAFYIAGTSFNIPFNGPYEATPSDCDPLTATVTLPTGQVWSSFLTFGTVSLPLISPPFPDDLCCYPCPIPKKDLTITVGGGSPHTLTYSGGNWSDGTYTLNCSDGTLTLHGPGAEVGDPPIAYGMRAGTTCTPFHVSFDELATGVVIVIDEPALMSAEDRKLQEHAANHGGCC